MIVKAPLIKLICWNVWRRNWGYTKQKAPFITKRGRFELIRKDSHKRRLSFKVFEQQAFFGSKLEEFGSQKIDFQAFQSFQQMKRRLFKCKRSTLTVNKRNLFNEEKKSKSSFKNQIVCES